MRIAFVSPWYEEHITGGAEAALRGLAHHLSDCGIDVEILTTRVKDFSSDWSTNYYKEGYSEEYGLKIRRFSVDQRNRLLFNALNTKILYNERLSPKEEKLFIHNMINCRALDEYISRHKDEYDLFVFMIYMFGTTYRGIKECPEKSVVIPCFHDEGYINLDIYKDVFKRAKGMIFLSEHEKTLAERVFDLRGVMRAVIGTGVDTDITGDADRFLDKYNIKQPFIIYAGRKDAGKNIYLMFKYFERYIKEHKDSDLRLVLIGGGDVWIPESIKERVIDLGFVDKQDKYDAVSAATLLCQPSLHESFSIVIMESWLCKRPVLVHNCCTVTADFASKSQGGYTFSDYHDYADSIDDCLEHEKIASEKGLNGYDFVMNNFSWDIVTKKTIAFLSELIDGKNDDGSVFCDNSSGNHAKADNLISAETTDSVESAQETKDLDIDTLTLKKSELQNVEKENLDYYAMCKNTKVMLDLKKLLKRIVYYIVIKMATI